MTPNAPLRVAMDASVTPGATGGVATAVWSLVRALGRVTDGPEEYTIVVGSERQAEWLQPILGPNQKLVFRPGSRKHPLLRPFMPAIRFVQNVLSPPRFWPEVPISDGFYEALGCEIVHFPTQRFTVCALPTVYNPHDLQHLHYPQFFSPSVLAWREAIYPAGCHFARTVIVNSQWIKDDLVRQYRIPPDKIQVIPEAAPIQAYPEPTAESLAHVQARYQLESGFGFYPSVAWPHKNHLRLFDALAHLRTQCGLRLQLVCVGGRHDGFWPAIADRLGALGLDAQVRFLGFVPPEDLRGLYRLAGFLVLPTLFEANSLPIFEAWAEGLPVACSNVTALPEQVRDAAVLFDPHDPIAIAEAMRALTVDSRLRGELRARGTQRLRGFNWDRTARAYRAVYRRAAGRTLGEEDHWLLQWDWMRESEDEVGVLRS